MKTVVLQKTRLPPYSDVRNTGHGNCGFTEDKTPSIQRCEEHGTWKLWF